MNCDSGMVRFGAFRHGTPGAPYRTSLAASGKYTGRGKGRLRVRLSTLVPGVVVRSTRVKYRVRCRSGRLIDLTETYEPFDLVGGRFADRDRAKGRLGTDRLRGFVCVAKRRFKGRFRGGPVGAEGPRPGR